ncbi:hypothetical protein RHMOL_Rhmol01G0084800 [Rhododendron molle]|uniref:Uncharacterized protein n=1 Tax=Rhododendron molle TaxID=49168 RepID=A0ACC0Q0S8_RHOML|nr:hypothetical protein RHMOL_Rhmol01G0084800 [Rhododendron molle]
MDETLGIFATMIVQNFNQWLAMENRTEADFYEMGGANNQVIIGMGEVFLQVFGSLTRRLGSLHEINSFSGNLWNTLIITTELEWLDVPVISTDFAHAPYHPNSDVYVRDGILRDLTDVRAMVALIIERFPPPSTLHQWKHVSEQPCYAPDWNSLSVYKAKRTAFFNYSSPIFLRKSQLCDLIHQINEIKIRNPGDFSQVVNLRDYNPNADTDMGNWISRLPQPSEYHSLIYDKDTNNIISGHRDNTVAHYLRAAYTHVCDTTRNKSSGEVLNDILGFFPDALPNIHYLLCFQLGNDAAWATASFQVDIVELLSDGPTGYKGFKRMIGWNEVTFFVENYIAYLLGYYSLVKGEI